MMFYLFLRLAIASANNDISSLDSLEEVENAINRIKAEERCLNSLYSTKEVLISCKRAYIDLVKNSAKRTEAQTIKRKCINRVKKMTARQILSLEDIRLSPINDCHAIKQRRLLDIKYRDKKIGTIFE